MPRGYSDFGLNPGDYGQFSGDNAELAARLMSPVVFERRGRVVWFDDMAQALSKYQVSIIAPATLDAVVDSGFLNGAAIRFVPDAGTLGNPRILFTLPIIERTKIGFECLFRWVSNNDANATTFDLKFYYHDGNIQHEYRYSFRPDIREIQVYSSLPLPGGFVTVFTTPYAFWGTGTEVGTSYFKTAFNLEDFTYDRIIFNELGASLKAYTSIPTPMITRPRLDVLLRGNGNPATNPVFVSDPLVTLDEP
jgi:hypothetical protein